MGDDVQKVEAKLSVKLLVGLIGTALAIAGAVAGIMGAVYCTKSEMQATKSELQADMTQVKLKAEQAAGDAKVRDWQIQTVQVRLDNAKQRQIQQSRNIEKLLNRFRVEAAPQPTIRSLPKPPLGGASSDDGY